MYRRTFHSSVSLYRGSSSSKEWLQRQRTDPYVAKRHAEGYRARSAYKLLEMNEKYNQSLLLGPGAVILECGAAPGAWTQVAAEEVNAQGKYNEKAASGMVVGCDLLDIEPVEGAVLFSNSDFTSKDTHSKILQATTDIHSLFDVVLSDMAPNASGQKELDQDRIIALSYSVLRFALLHSNAGANFVTKIWMGPKVENLLKDIKKFYHNVDRVKPMSSRKDSGEIYLVGRDFKGIKRK